MMPCSTSSRPSQRKKREALGLTGLVPEVTESEDVWLGRVVMRVVSKASNLERYIYLTGLLNPDENIFYRTIMSDPARFLPIIYAPSIDAVCLKDGHILRQTRGMHLSIRRTGRIAQICTTGRGRTCP